MSILSNIFDRIFRRPGSRAEPSGDVAVATQPTSGTATAENASANQGGGTATAVRPEPVDVEAVLNGMAQKNPQKLNWRTSIVDLMKLLDLDSSLQARKQLATELNYAGDMGDSAAMNMWLHKQVMKKLAENGGKVPADLRD